MRPGLLVVVVVSGAVDRRTPSQKAFRVHLSETELQEETNASVLAMYYEDRQLKYRGVEPPPWQSWPDGSAADSPIHSPLKLDNGTELTVDQAGLAYELMISHFDERKTAGEGSVWFGVDTLIDPIDAAVFSTLLWEQQPDLIIEIGTECGGSSTFFASTMRMYSDTGRVVTYDVTPTWARCSRDVYQRRRSGGWEPTRRTWKGYQSKLWSRHVTDGVLVPRVADVTSPQELAFLANISSRAETVWIVDDGDHTTTPLLVHFHLLARHVTPGAYYIIADTRLDRMCKRGTSSYCRGIVGHTGGPARAVRYLQGESAAFQQAFYVDRSAERWAFTQHPGGFLRKRCHVDCSRLAEEVRALPVSRSPDRAPAARRFDACCTTNR